MRSRNKNIRCAGDDQSIYPRRGAEVENILRFEHDFPGAVVRLNRTTAPPHRSLPRHQARSRTTRDDWAHAAPGLHDPSGERGVTVTGLGPRRQSAWSVTGLRRCSRPANRWSEMAIPVRAGFQTRVRLITFGV